MQKRSAGRAALRKKRTDHISNFEIYYKIGIYPIKVVCVIQTLLFWLRQFHRATHPALGSALNSIFATSRKTSFVSATGQPRPMKVLLESYEFYRSHCRATGRIPKMFKNLSKEELDAAFQLKKAKISSQVKRKNTQKNSENQKKFKKIGKTAINRKRKSDSSCSIMSKRMKSNFDFLLL